MSTGTKITGRLDTITLREGGTVRYTYSGGNSGIDCNYWVTPVLTRTLGNGDVTTYTLTHPFVSGSNYQALNTVVDPGGNQTEYTFTGFTSSGASSTYAQALTQKKVYSGNGAGKSLLYTELRSYNSAFTSTPNATTISQTTVSLPVGEIVVYRQYAGQSGWAAVDTAYDSYGNPLSVSQYDYGVATPAITTTTAYGSCTASCTSNLPTVLNTSMAANGIFNKPGSLKTTIGRQRCCTDKHCLRQRRRRPDDLPLDGVYVAEQYDCQHIQQQRDSAAPVRREQQRDGLLLLDGQLFRYFRMYGAKRAPAIPDADKGRHYGAAHGLHLRLRWWRAAVSF